MRIDIITIFPELFQGHLANSILGRASAQGIVKVNPVDLRGFTHDAHRTVDDKPFGGGPGMLMKVEPLFEAVESLRTDSAKVILTSPQGEQFKQSIAQELSNEQHLIFICGHYEGVDERARQALVDRELSIGDYILTSGNLPALVMVDAIVRLLPGALGCPESSVSESFSDGLLEYPQYTRPPEFRGMRVPDVLLSGNHAKIAQWRLEQSKKRTMERRPDLLDRGGDALGE